MQVQTILRSQWLFLAACCWAGPLCRGDTFYLRDGGRVEGELLNPQANGEPLEIRLETGGLIVLHPDRIKKVVPSTPEHKQYRKWLGEMQDTAEHHWKLSVWCQKKGLTEERTYHLEQTIRLDPDHQQARQALGYQYVQGEWLQADEQMIKDGFVKYKGRWRLPQDVERLERDEQLEQVTADWTRKLRLWQRWLGTSREPQALANISAISDPRVVPVVVKILEREELPSRQTIWIQVLGKLPSGASIAALVRGALSATHRSVRSACIDELERLQARPAIPIFVAELQSSDNLRIRRAAAALKRLGDDSAILPLIRALVTEHPVLVATGDPNRVDALFNGGASSQGTGFSTGQRPKIVPRQVQNREVLEALVELTGVDFQFDQLTWLNWYIQKEAPPPGVSLRRGT